MKSAKQILDQYGMTRQTLKSKTKLLKIKAKMRAVNGGFGFVYTADQVRRITKGFTPQTKHTKSSKKLDVIETYFAFGNYANVHIAVGVSQRFVRNTINEWKNTGNITIESKMNNLN